MSLYFASTALLPHGWENDVTVDIDDNGIITNVGTGKSTAGAKRLDGPLIPGMPNLHSHAFQRKMAGLTEYATAKNDSFWTWRTLMYDFLARLDVEELETIATKLYTDMRRKGYAHVGEFHYIHHAPGGTPYNDRAETSRAMIRAAKAAGIGITILPVLYAYSNFGHQPPNDGQKRFINTADQYLDILSSLHKTYKHDTHVRVGACFHSLRAVSPEMISDVLAEAGKLDPAMPIHIHIAEQEKEVDDCRTWCGARPVEWLFDHAPVDEKWCLVHATHMTERETGLLAKSGAVAGLCPTTEANLGDGLFNLPDYIAQQGRFGVGSDSHITVDPWEELRLLEYGQRLLRRQRAIAKTETKPHVGTFLYKEALRGGAQALGIKAGKIEKGYKADLLVLTPEDAIAQDALLDSLIFAGNIEVETL